MKNNMLKIVIYFLTIQCLYSQSNLIYRFKVKDNNFKDTLTITNFDKKNEFNCERKFYADNSFSDSKLLCIKETNDCSLFFKKKPNNDWQLKSANKWVKLFSYKDNKILTVINKQKDFILKPQNIITINNDTLYAFTISSFSKITACGEGFYWFSPKYGIVAIKGTHVLLVREDFSQSLK